MNVIERITLWLHFAAPSQGSCLKAMMQSAVVRLAKTHTVWIPHRRTFAFVTKVNAIHGRRPKTIKYVVVGVGCGHIICTWLGIGST